MENLKSIVLDLYKKGQETSKHYKSKDVFELVDKLKSEGLGDEIVVDEMTVNDYYQLINHLPKNSKQTSKLFKTFILKRLIEILESHERHHSPKKYVENSIIEKKIDNIEKAQGILFEMLITQQVIIKALVNEVSKKKLREEIEKIVESFEYGLKYDLPFEELKGKSFYLQYDDEMILKVAKSLRKIV